MFSIQLKQGIEKPDYIINFHNKIKDDKKSIIITLTHEILKENIENIENKFIEQINLINNIKINKNDNEEYEIIYPKCNDLKFFRILKNILIEYKPLLNIDCWIDDIHDKNNYDIIHCEFNSPKYNLINLLWVYEDNSSFGGQYRGWKYYNVFNKTKNPNRIIEYYMNLHNFNIKYIHKYGTCDRIIHDYILNSINEIIDSNKIIYDILQETIINNEYWEDLKQIEKYENEQKYLNDNISNYNEIFNEYRNKINELNNKIEQLKNENIDLYSSLI